MKDLISTTIAWTLSIVVTVLAGLSFNQPDLINFVAAYGILIIICGIFVAGLLECVILGYDKTNPDHDKVKDLIIRVRKTTGSVSKRVLKWITKLIIIASLIYGGWIFTSVVLLLVQLWCMSAFTRTRNLELE